MKLFTTLKEEIKNEIISIFIIVLSLYGAYVLYTNSGGYIGWAVYKILRGLSGQGAIGIPFFFLIIGFNKLFWPKNINYTRIIGIALLLLTYIQTCHIIFISNDPQMTFAKLISFWVDMGLSKKGGGLLGGILTYFLGKLIGQTGVYVFLSLMGLISLMLIFDFSIKRTFEKYKGESQSKENRNKRKKIKVIGDINIIKENQDKPQDNKSKEKNTNHLEIIDYRDNLSVEPIQDTSVEIKDSNFDLKETNESQDTLNYQFPPMSLMTIPAKTKGREQDVAEMAKKLEDTLDSFGVKGKVLKAQRGPTITRFELQPERGVKVSRIINLSDDLALSMATADVRIEAPIPGKAAVGIEVPNKIISTVHLREVIDTNQFKLSTSPLTLGMGKDIAGNPVIADLAKMPHLLIAGATGSGKSVCINSIIISLIYKASPAEVKLLMIDPKMVELINYNGIPHLVSPVVTDPRKSTSVLEWAVSEMNKRYKKFSEKGTRDLSRYNELLKSSGEKPLPQLVLIIDELADLMMVAPAEVEDSICRLAQMARASGIHLIVATQRPSVDVITGLIKANIPSRVSFAVSSQTDSRTILDMGGAEKLLGNGDMLFYPYGAPKPIRLQGSYISDSEVEKIVSFVKQGYEPKFIMDPDKLQVSKPSVKSEQENDSMFIEAVNLVLDSGQASISLLQRRLHIGYTRAARLIDEMEEKGIVGKYEGTKPREILISKEQFKRLYQNTANDEGKVD